MGCHSQAAEKEHVRAEAGASLAVCADTYPRGTSSLTRRALAGKLPQALPLHGGYISMGKASPAERLLPSRGDSRDWAAA